MPNLTVVLDIGQFSTKIGFAGEDSPSNVFFTIVGKPKYQNLNMQDGLKPQEELYVGDEIQSLGLFKIFSPIDNGRIGDWKHFTKIMDYIFYSLRVDPTLVNVLYSIHPSFPRDELQKLFELFLEHYQCMAFYPVLDSQMTLYSGGFQTGLVIEIGDSGTRIVPIYKGFKIEHAIQNLEMGGKVLTKYMEKILGSVGFAVGGSIGWDLVRVLKEKASFISLDYNEDIKRHKQYNKQFSLPDGAVLALTKERFMLPEAIFDPSVVNLEEDSLPVAIMNSIDLCDIDVRPELLNNIFLSGGSSMFPNIKSRLYKELELELARRKKGDQVVKIMAPRERTFSVWIGGSILALIPEFSNNWISRTTYLKDGIPNNLL